MSLIAQSTDAFTRIYWSILWFSIFISLAFNAIEFATGVDFFPYFIFGINPSDGDFVSELASRWSAGKINEAIATLQSAEGLDVFKAILQIISAILGLIVKVLVNAVFLLHAFVSLFLRTTFTLIALPQEYVNTLSNMVAWLIYTPLVFGAVMHIAQFVYSLMPFGGGGAGG